METEAILDTILIPRPNGSENLDTVASALAESLANAGALVSEQYFTATAHGFQLVWIMAVVMMAAYAYCLLKGKYVAAALIPVVLAVLLVLEFEYLVSTVSALSNDEERNIIGTFPGREGAPLLIFSAHYDTATHFGDHFSWGRWGKLQGPATGIAIRFPLLALDRILAKPPNLISSIEVHQTPLARIASDHLPVKARLNLDGIRQLGSQPEVA